MSLLHSMFGQKEDVEFSELVKQGAIILDVRTKEEFNEGHVKGAINIPLDVLSSNLKKLGDKNTPIIACCASGARSGVAKNILKESGHIHVFNGGGYHSLQRKLTN